uniref:Uncharacterized protein n=1 Tax=Tanacetum cinerariifolium TaxID=118510 RepID=A0A699K0N5_TANCI|nr:hypothetical protein [Tanacetum cinerariifolium]
MGTHDDEAKSSRSKRSRQYETVEEAVELDEEGFNVYFEGGLCNDEHFKAQEYWLSISREDNLGLSRSHTSTIKSPFLRFISKIARKSRVLMDDVIRSLSALINYRDLDTTMIRDLIDSEGRLIPKDLQPGVPIVGVPRPPRASMQDLYDKVGRMEIRQEAIKQMEYRQSYHWDRYLGLFENMAGVYSVLLQGAYNPPSFAQPQYDQYYQQYPPLPP